VDIKFIGSHLEASCSGCGEVLLVGPDEDVDFRSCRTQNLGGVEVPTPDGLLCAACSKNENGSARQTIRFTPMVCLCCGEGIKDEGFEPDFDESGDLRGFFCKECSEPWRRGR